MKREGMTGSRQVQGQGYGKSGDGEYGDAGHGASFSLPLPSRW